MCNSDTFNPLIAKEANQTLDNTIEYLESLANTAANAGADLCFVVGLRTAALAIESANNTQDQRGDRGMDALSQDGKLSLSVVN